MDENNTNLEDLYSKFYEDYLIFLHSIEEKVFSQEFLMQQIRNNYILDILCRQLQRNDLINLPGFTESYHFLSYQFVLENNE